MSAIVAVLLAPVAHQQQTAPDPQPAEPAQAPSGARVNLPPASVQPARAVLENAAQRHGVDPDLVLALAWWESGWDQSRVSETGAVGLMQVQPEGADTAGPQLLGRKVDVHNPVDNADMGVALLRQLLADTNGDTQLA